MVAGQMYCLFFLPFFLFLLHLCGGPHLHLTTFCVFPQYAVLGCLQVISVDEGMLGILSFFIWFFFMFGLIL